MHYSKEELIKNIQKLSSESDRVEQTQYSLGPYGTYISSHIFDAWRNKILAFLGSDQIAPPNIVSSIEHMKNTQLEHIIGVKAELSSLVELIENDLIDISEKSNSGDPALLERTFKRFHKVVRQLRTRYDNRSTLTIGDEYDVQDLLHALLYLFFDDIRAEEWTPSYAGASARMDFLIKDIQTVIEVKKTRESMSAKELGEQLIVDIKKYKEHPDCKKLVCFVYDPDGFLGNPTGIINDLEKDHKDFLKVIIEPN